MTAVLFKFRIGGGGGGGSTDTCFSLITETIGRRCGSSEPALFHKKLIVSC